MNVSCQPGAAGFEQWLHDINQICGAFTAQPLAEDFSGGISEFRQGALKLSFVDACHARLARTPREVAASDDSKYFAVFQLQGRAGMAQGDQRTLLQPGEITLIDAARPSEFTYGENSRQLSLILPHALVEQAVHYNKVQCGQAIPASAPLAMLAHRLVLDTAQQGSLTQLESEATLQALVSLLSPALAATAGRADPHERNLRRALAYIDEHLRDETLCPEQLAREVGVSVRGLYRLFAAKGLVVAQHIKNRRLDCCAQSLRQAAGEQKLSALGYSWGFCDSSYFSTAFKGRFGITPGEYRKRHAPAH